jgi:hypothetical protein
VIKKLLSLNSLIPNWAIKQMAIFGFAHADVCLCLHRVGPPKSEDRPDVNTSIPAQALDELLELLGARGTVADSPKIVATFDDGYADAVAYVESRHDRFPNIEWVFFICPAKTQGRVGFRWDAADLNYEIQQPYSINQENLRKSLHGVADLPSSQLATVQQLRNLADLPRVILGNHTNSHFALSVLSHEDCRAELAQSRQDFEALFGPTEHFAFPFGVPERHFTLRDVELLRAEGYRYLYTTSPRPVRHGGSPDNQLLPRFTVMGNWSPRKNAMLISLIALRERVTSSATNL